MSTNFYWMGDKPLSGFVQLPNGKAAKFSVDMNHPNVHIGKRYSAGAGKLGFIWAQDPQIVNKICLGSMDRDVVVDEYGLPYTGRQFLRSVVNCIDSDDLSSIGKAFS